MFYPTITHALSIMIAINKAFINEGVTNMFAFQFILRISKIFSVTLCEIRDFKVDDTDFDSVQNKNSE